jgi:hypothetical protein
MASNIGRSKQKCADEGLETSDPTVSDSGIPQENLAIYVLPSHSDTVSGHRNAPVQASTVGVAGRIFRMGGNDGRQEIENCVGGLT